MGDAEAEAQAGQAEGLGEGPQHDQVVVLPGEVEVAGGVGVVDVGLVEGDEGVWGRLDDAANVGLLEPGARRRVRVRDEHDAGVVLDGVEVGVDVARHRGGVEVHGLAALGLGEEVVHREAGAGHEDLATGFRVGPDDEGDDLGLAGAAHEVLGDVAVLLGEGIA